jgi:hypothetical protein
MLEDVKRLVGRRFKFEIVAGSLVGDGHRKPARALMPKKGDLETVRLSMSELSVWLRWTDHGHGRSFRLHRRYNQATRLGFLSIHERHDRSRPFMCLCGQLPDSPPISGSI